MHVIRLRGPWDYEPVARFVTTPSGEEREETDGLPHGGKASMPRDWGAELGERFQGRVRYTRRFNCPTNLEPLERVWLVFDGIDHEARVALNEQPLGELRGCLEAHRIEITPVLLPHNVLSVEVSLRPAVFADSAARGNRAGRSGGLFGEVRLEIGRV
jgi:beta-galactosidase/beta-glucuronidase